MSAPLTGDALILALAAEYRAAAAAWNAFDTERLRWSGTMCTHLGGHSHSQGARWAGIETAIAAIKADGPAGAMVQLELLNNWVEAGETGDEFQDRERRELSEFMIWSVYGVLAGMTEHTTAAGLNAMPACGDVHRTDIKALPAEKRAWLEAEGIECIPRIRAKREKAGAVA